MHTRQRSGRGDDGQGTVEYIGLGVVITAIIGTLSPIVTVVIAVSVLGEAFGAPEAIGTACVLGGVALFSWIESRPARNRARP